MLSGRNRRVGRVGPANVLRVAAPVAGTESLSTAGLSSERGPSSAAYWIATTTASRAPANGPAQSSGSSRIA